MQDNKSMNALTNASDENDPGNHHHHNVNNSTKDRTAFFSFSPSISLGMNGGSVLRLSIHIVVQCIYYYYIAKGDYILQYVCDYKSSQGFNSP